MWALLRGCGAGVAGVGWGGDGGGRGGRDELVHLGASGGGKAPFLPVLHSAASASTDEKAREEGEVKGKGPSSGCEAGDAEGAAGEACEAVLGVGGGARMVLVMEGVVALPCAPFACCFFVPPRPSFLAVVDF